MKSDDQTRFLWNYEFELTYTVKLSDNELYTDFQVINRSKVDFDFTCLLHTYFKVDLVNTEIQGLQNSTFIDKLDTSRETLVESRKSIRIARETDRIYLNTKEINLIQPNSVINIDKTFADTVLWNPWIEKSKQLTDFLDQEYLEMVCVESGNVADKVKLAPGKEIIFSQKITVISE